MSLICKERNGTGNVVPDASDGHRKGGSGRNRSAVWSGVVVFMLPALVLAGVACGQSDRGSTADRGKKGAEEHVFAVQLVDDDQVRERYLAYHADIWPEVEQAFARAGYEHIRLYYHSGLVVMIVTVPADADLGAMGQIAEASHPRVAEWNRLMDGFQRSLRGVSGETWLPLDRIYEFRSNSSYP